MTEGFIDFSAVDEKETDFLAECLINALKPMEELVALNPRDEAILLCQNSIREQIRRLEKYKQIVFDDRPIGFLDGERRIFEVSVSLLRLILDQSQLLKSEANSAFKP